jgi:hypothetical protein
MTHIKFHLCCYGSTTLVGNIAGISTHCLDISYDANTPTPRDLINYENYIRNIVL